jgi:circadian clock protein KaiC
MAKKSKPATNGISKCLTGIQGLDEVTFVGLPRGRPTLVCGGAGCGKTLLGMEFLVRGAIQYDEPGVCISFEETAEELAQNVGSIGFDVNALISKKSWPLTTYK